MNNLNDLKNKRKGIRNLISVTKSVTSVPNTLFQNNEPITDPKKKKTKYLQYISFFSAIAAKTKSNIKFSKKTFL